MSVLRTKLLTGGLALVFGLAGCEGALSRVVGVATVTAEHLRDQLEEEVDLLLVDVRKRTDYESGHIKGAVSVTTDQLHGFLTRSKEAQARPVVTVCYHGVLSLEAALVVSSRGQPQVRSLSGGMHRWRELGYPEVCGAGPRLAPELLAPRELRATWFEQVAITVSGFLIKPLYMVLTLLLVLFLRYASSRDLVLTRRALVAFLVGESICAANFLVAGGTSAALELLHGAGMVVMGALLPWGIFVLVDHRILHLADPEARCLVQRFCGHCSKREPVSCGVQRMFIYATAAMALVTLMPLTSPLRPLNVTIPVLGGDVQWVKPFSVMVVELRLYPVLGALLFALALIGLKRGGDSIRTAELPFFLGVGVSSFSLFRYFLLETYRHMPIWGDIWEELTELFIVALTGLFLMVFRKQLGLRHDSAAEPPPS
ncbi:rhodanese-like domain-containing protein [Planctomycetota bacterium]